MTDANQKKLFALSKKEWDSSTDEQKLSHYEEFETEIFLAICECDPGDLGFNELDWNFIQEHKEQINLDLKDQEKLSIFEDDAEDLIEALEEYTGEDTLSSRYDEDEGASFSEEEKLALVNDYLSRFGLEGISSWIIDNQLDESTQRKYNLEVANFFYNSWFWQKYHKESAAKDDKS